ncbi:hypothetical protein, partial [Salmonella sp. SAL04281]|uniref:hypothetical protein n=1 Tax=Salmonella sp. SAL04281 TaxID=3159859 RepID=UPI00397B7FE1
TLLRDSNKLEFILSFPQFAEYLQGTTKKDIKDHPEEETKDHHPKQEPKDQPKPEIKEQPQHHQFAKRFNAIKKLPYFTRMNHVLYQAITILGA